MGFYIPVQMDGNFVTYIVGVIVKCLIRCKKSFPQILMIQRIIIGKIQGYIGVYRL